MTVNPIFKKILRLTCNLGGLRKFYLLGYIVLLIADVTVMYGYSVSVGDILFRVFIYIASWFVIQFIDYHFLRFILAGIVLGVLSCVDNLFSGGGSSDIAGLTINGGLSNVGTLWILINFVWIIFVLWIGVYLGRWFQYKKKQWKWCLSIVLLMCGYILAVGLSLWYEFYNNLFLLGYTGYLLGLMTYWFEGLVMEVSRVRPDSVSVLGVKVGNWSMDSCIAEIGKMVEEGGFHRVVTPYSEFFIRAWKDSKFRKALDTAEVSVADGIFVHWSATYLSIPMSTVWPVRICYAILGYIFSGACVILYPEYIRMVIQDRVSGSDLLEPLCAFAVKNGYSMLFIGGQDWGKGNAGVLAAEILRKKYKGLNIVEVYPGERKNESREEALEVINRNEPDIVCVCFGGGASEMWLYENRQKMKCKVAIGLGGTFDFIAGYASKVLPIYSRLGLEWFVRPFSKERGGLTNNVKRCYRVWRGMLKSSIIVLLMRMKSKKEVDL